jgi:RNA-splicing ligase RtcB
MYAEDWLLDTENKLETVGCNDEEKVHYAVHQLIGLAAAWWVNFKAIQPVGGVITWELFKQKFREAHVPTSIVELMKKEFENLSQGNMYVLKYMGEFNRLSRYAKEEVDT